MFTDEIVGWYLGRLASEENTSTIFMDSEIPEPIDASL